MKLRMLYLSHEQEQDYGFRHPTFHLTQTY